MFDVDACDLVRSIEARHELGCMSCAGGLVFLLMVFGGEYHCYDSAGSFI